jgi:predicted O-methyltransferase YrrM
MASRRRRGEERARAADLRRLRRNVPGFTSVEAELADARDTLSEPWQAYVQAISPDWMAASVEVCALLLALARLRRPSRILDLGSGFSSYAMRTYALGTGGQCRVVSVDDDADWLEKTRRALQARGVPADDLYTWESFRAARHEPFGLVFHDLGDMAVRAATLPAALALVAANGVIVLDDMHKDKEGYPGAARRACAAAGFDLYSLETLTTDRFGRCGAIALPR